MSQVASNIHFGPARIFVGVTNPATGTPPTEITHTNGVPSTGTEIGYTTGDCVFEYILTKTEITAEQALAPVDIAVTQEMVHLTFTCQESNYVALKTAFDSGIGNQDNGTIRQFYSGNNFPTPATQSVFFSSPRRDSPTKFFIGLIYKAYMSAKGFNFTFSKTKPAIFAIDVIGIIDGTRNAGDGLFQFQRED